MERTVQYNYDQDADEFFENPSGNETGSITGNRVWITSENPLRFRIEIDDFGYVIAAFNRLVQRQTPTFIFPVTKSQ